MSVNPAQAYASAVDDELRARLATLPLAALLVEAARLRDAGHGTRITCSRSVLISLARTRRGAGEGRARGPAPRNGTDPWLTPAEVLAVARAGESAGCTGALLALDLSPGRRHPTAGEALQPMRHASRVDYLVAMCELVLRETSLLPHVDAGVTTRDEIARLRRVSVSQRLAPAAVFARRDRSEPAPRSSPGAFVERVLACLQAAGALQVPFSCGIPVGTGETREQRLDALLALRRVHASHGHLQEIEIGGFGAQAAAGLAQPAGADSDELAWTVAAARLIFGPAMHVRTSHEVRNTRHRELIAAGVDDWAGLFAEALDRVDGRAETAPAAALRDAAKEAGKVLVARLPVHREYCLAHERWLDPKIAALVLRSMDADGFARDDDWTPGGALALGAGVQGSRPRAAVYRTPDNAVERALQRAMAGDDLAQTEIVALLEARGSAIDSVCAAADALRERTCGDTVRYVVNRNITYTNVCKLRCGFCAFARRRHAHDLRGDPYDLDREEIDRRTREAWQRGATEVCMQGGIHPDYTGETYLALVRAVREAVPAIHVHALSPLEVLHGASTLGLPVARFLERLRDAGLGTLPGTAAEVLHDDVRRMLCPDKMSTQTWLDVVETAHRVGLASTATIMFGHVDSARHCASHLAAIRRLQARTGGFTELVPLPFVHMQAPIYREGRARRGPTSREALLMHAVARLALHPLIPNVQVSWVKMGVDGVRACLAAGANDTGGTLMNESISRAAGTGHGEEMAPRAMDELIVASGRLPAQRTTLYAAAPEAQRLASYRAAPLAPAVEPRASRRAALVETGARARAATPSRTEPVP